MTAKIETIRRPRNVIERLLDAVERIAVIRDHEADPTVRKHIARALDETKTAAGDNDPDRIMRGIKLLEAVAKKHDQPVAEATEFRWPVFIEPKTMIASGHIGLALLAEGFLIMRQNVSVNCETGNYLVDQYERDGEAVHVKLPPPEERRLVMLA
jgi:hypothetical protein